MKVPHVHLKDPSADFMPSKKCDSLFHNRCHLNLKNSCGSRIKCSNYFPPYKLVKIRCIWPVFLHIIRAKRKNSPITSFHQLRVHINEWNHGCLPQISKELRCACRRLSWKNFWNKNWCLFDCYSLKKSQSFYSRFWFKRFPQHWMRIRTIFGEFPKNCKVRCGFPDFSMPGHDLQVSGKTPPVSKKSQINKIWFILLMAEILHHLGCMKPYK